MTARDYESQTLTVHWDAGICIHSGHCAASLGAVFRPDQRPWIDVSGAADEAIALTIDGCPSGALSYTRTVPEEPAAATGVAAAADEVTVRVWANGPYEIAGPVRVLDTDGNLIRQAHKVSLCRCGNSNAKPFCDGTHKHCGFDDPGVFRKPDRGGQAGSEG